MVRHQNEGRVSVATIAREEQISAKFLETIFLSLKHAGILSSRKGKGGGYYFQKEPATIVMADVMRILEGPIAMVPCVSLNYYEPCDDCQDPDNCRIQALMLRVRDANLDVYRATTLADLG